jgi:hypothetical protein
MKDIAYFATALEGMDQQVFLSADVTRKVKDLKIENLDLKTADNIQLKGTLNLPDFRNFEHAFFKIELDRNLFFGTVIFLRFKKSQNFWCLKKRFLYFSINFKTKFVGFKKKAIS